MSVHAHNDWQDSVMEWAHENAAELKHFTGCNQNCNQGRACVCQPKEAASACTEVGADSPQPVVGREAFKVWSVLMGPATVALVCGLLTWMWKTYV